MRRRRFLCDFLLSLINLVFQQKRGHTTLHKAPLTRRWSEILNIFCLRKCQRKRRVATDSKESRTRFCQQVSCKNVAAAEMLKTSARLPSVRQRFLSKILRRHPKLHFCSAAQRPTSGASNYDATNWLWLRLTPGSEREPAGRQPTFFFSRFLVLRRLLWRHDGGCTNPPDDDAKEHVNAGDALFWTAGLEDHNEVSDGETVKLPSGAHTRAP